MVHLYIYNREIAKILLRFKLNNVIQAYIFLFPLQKSTKYVSSHL